MKGPENLSTIPTELFLQRFHHQTEAVDEYGGETHEHAKMANYHDALPPFGDWAKDQRS